MTYPFWDHYAWDIETYPNIFTCVVTHIVTRTRWVFEVSTRRNQSSEFVSFIYYLKSIGAKLVGFNSEGFDYPAIHKLLRAGAFTAKDAFEKATAIIVPPVYEMGQFLLYWNLAPYPDAYVTARDVWKVASMKPKKDEKQRTVSDELARRGLSPDAARECAHLAVNANTDRFAHSVWASDRVLPQIDLFKIHHFDNQAKSTSLKAVEIALKMTNVEDLPFNAGEPVPDEGFDNLIQYNAHDVEATCQLAEHTAEALEFREKLSIEYGIDMTNFNDTKIGKEYFRLELEKASPGCTGTKKNPRQTPRQSINLGELIVPYAQFNRPEFRAARDEIAGRTITHTKDVLKGVSALVNGFRFDFGTGGIHGSVESRTFRSDGEWEIWDWDVASYYPNLAIANGFRPAHLGDTFNTVYKRLYDYRLEVGKKTLAGATIKLALNGVYGDSNSKFSPFYDPAFTMSITINGQLLLCMLAEWMLDLGGVHMIQANTDGITVLVHHTRRDAMFDVAKKWEAATRLELESVKYEQMSIRDVNNYVATSLGKSGDLNVKRKGAYEFNYQLHQNPSATILARAATDAIVHGTPVQDTISKSQDPFEFLYRYKGQRRDQIVWGGDLEEYDTGRQSRHDLKSGTVYRPIMAKRHNGHGQVIQRTGRFYLASQGAQLWKIMPPLPKDPNHLRPQAIEKGIPTAIANRGADFNPAILNYGAYIDKASELVRGVGL